MDLLSTRGRAGFSWSQTIDAVGTDRFAVVTVAALNVWIGVEHCCAFTLGTKTLRLLAAGSVDGLGTAHALDALEETEDFWRNAPTVQRAQSAIGAGDIAYRVHRSELEGQALPRNISLKQEICDHVLLCGRRGDRHYGFGMLRTFAKGEFKQPCLDRIADLADPMLSLVARHDRFVKSSEDSPAVLFRSVPDIEARVREILPALSQRETQVCARILRGVSTPGIALDLGLREDSIATYRKRAYRRLAIGTRYELLQLYVGAAKPPPSH